MIVGAICAAVHNAVMILGDLSGAYFVAMMFLSFSIVTPLGYVLHSSFTFGERRSPMGLLRFFIASSIGFSLFFISMLVLCTGLGLRAAIATPLVTGMLFLWNYVSAHWAIIGHMRLFKQPQGK